jgi:endonuclease/exonuclease/phosphatase family metal-dependent hydrolase
VVALVCLAYGCNVNHGMRPQASSGGCPERMSDGAPVEWYGPEKGSDRKKHDEWCATVGPIFIDSVPRAEFPRWDIGDSLAVVTWNMFVGGGDLVEFLRGELGLACEGDVRLWPETPFVLLLQEARRASSDLPDINNGPWSTHIQPDPFPGEHDDIVDIARRCGLAFFYAPTQRNGYQVEDGLKEERGIAILSTLQLSDFIAIELPFEASRKVTVAATVRTVNGDSLRVVNTHLDVGASLYRTFTTGNSTRLRQALGLIDALVLIEKARSGGDVSCGSACDPERFAGYPIATVAGGDINTWSEEETALRRLREYFPDSPPPGGMATRTWFPTDHLFFRAGGSAELRLVPGSYRRIKETYCSDHHAQIMWLADAGPGEE